jgi:hypothetical protein
VTSTQIIKIECASVKPEVSAKHYRKAEDGEAGFRGISGKISLK